MALLYICKGNISHHYSKYLCLEGGTSTNTETSVMCPKKGDKTSEKPGAQPCDERLREVGGCIQH